MRRRTTSLSRVWVAVHGFYAEVACDGVLGFRVFLIYGGAAAGDHVFVLRVHSGLAFGYRGRHFCKEFRCFKSLTWVSAGVPYQKRLQQHLGLFIER
ncbi:hypothetical protein SLA2020_267260 [Shorea laevis]